MIKAIARGFRWRKLLETGAYGTIEEIAAADASAGWVLMLAMQSNAFAGFMEERHALEVWGNGGIICGTARPIGRAVATSTPEPGRTRPGHALATSIAPSRFSAETIM